MTSAELAVLFAGLLLILGGFALSYRYTVSPKAAERGRRANERFRHTPDIPLDPRLWRALIIGYLAAFAVRMLLQLGLGWSWAILITPAFFIGASFYIWRKKREEEEPPTDEDK